MRQVGVDRQIQAWRPTLDPAQHQMLHGIEADRPALDGAADAGQHVLEAEHLQQPQDLDILALAGLAHAGLQEAAQGGELFG